MLQWTAWMETASTGTGTGSRRHKHHTDARQNGLLQLQIYTNLTNSNSILHIGKCQEREPIGTILQMFGMLRLLVADSGPFQDHSYPFSSSCQPLLFSWWILAQRPLEKKWNKRGWKITAQKHCFWLVFSLQERMWQDLLRREALTWIHSKQSLHSRRQDLNLAKVRECCRSA